MEDFTPHILVIDDDTRLRELLRDYMTKSGYVVSTAEDAAEARRRMAGVSFDLLVVDVMMPGESGLEFVEDLRRSSGVPVLMLTAMGEAEDRIAGLERGADDYLAKPFEPRELLLRIQGLLRRAKLAAPALPAEPVSFGGFVFEPERGELLRGEDKIRLTSNEIAILKLFTERLGVTISRREISENGGGASERAVDVQIARLRRKIEADPHNPRYLQTVWGEGYAFRPD